MGILRDYVIEQAKIYNNKASNKEKKNKTPQEWLTDVLNKIDDCTLATHVGKFTHPGSKISLYSQDRSRCAGYVSSSNSLCQTDIVVNAAYLATASILLKELEDGQVVLEHFRQRTEFLANELAEFDIDINGYADKVDKISAPSYPDKTEGILKQVYFPVENTYKILTVLPSSSLFLTLGKRLDSQRNHYADCQNKKSAKYGQSRSIIRKLTTITFGGGRPLNISALNSQYGRLSRLLPSLPPVWSDDNIRLPKENFFGEIIYEKDIHQDLINIRKLYVSIQNNFRIRNSRQRILAGIDSVIYSVVQRADDLCMVQSGWSDKLYKLPEHQKIWLDSRFIEYRCKHHEWLELAGMDFGRWITKEVASLSRHTPVLFGDMEMLFLAKRFCYILRKEMR